MQDPCTDTAPDPTPQEPIQADHECTAGTEHGRFSVTELAGRLTRCSPMFMLAGLWSALSFQVEGSGGSLGRLPCSVSTCHLLNAARIPSSPAIPLLYHPADSLLKSFSRTSPFQRTHWSLYFLGRIPHPVLCSPGPKDSQTLWPARVWGTQPPALSWESGPSKCVCGGTDLFSDVTCPWTDPPRCTPYACLWAGDNLSKLLRPHLCDGADNNTTAGVRQD